MHTVGAVRSSRSPRGLSLPQPPSGRSSSLRLLLADGTHRLHTRTPCAPLFCVPRGENPRTVHPRQVQQLEKGLPGRLKVVAKSTEGTETVEGIYNTVSVRRASRGWTDTLMHLRR